MSAQPPILESKPPSDEQKRLVSLFEDMERKQGDFLDEASKRIIELVTALLGVLFAVTAFGDKFPPPYIKGNAVAQTLTVLALALYLAAMGMALRAVQPRNYKLYRHNLTEMRKVLDQIVADKAGALKLAGAFFGLASLTLALLIITIIFSA